jgi:tyrosyl-tRNA synthetase
MISDFLHETKARGFLYQATNLEGLSDVLKKQKITGYIGFDATATSLQVGNLVMIMWLRLLEKFGHQPLVVLGGATSRIGDPSGKNETRQLLTEEKLNENIKGISLAFGKFLKNPTILNNDNWLANLNYINFLRDYGRHFSINRMITFDNIKSRLTNNQSLSFLEFNYTLFQSYDFLELYKKYGCVLQMGGSEQWANIVSGVDLVKKITGKEVFGLTAPLVTNSDGSKMGKTAKGAVWLNEAMLSAYDYWQFWRNTSDKDVLRYLKIFTDLSLEEINKMTSLQGAELNEAKIILADETTKLAHGSNVLKEIHQSVGKVFNRSAEGSYDNLPSILVKEQDGSILEDLLVENNIFASKSEFRRMVAGMGVKINDTTINDSKMLISKNLLSDGIVKLSIGKKKHFIIRFNV